jgi:hypothetical protein
MLSAIAKTVSASWSPLGMVASLFAVPTKRETDKSLPDELIIGI